MKGSHLRLPFTCVLGGSRLVEKGRLGEDASAHLPRGDVAGAVDRGNCLWLRPDAAIRHRIHFDALAVDDVPVLVQELP